MRDGNGDWLFKGRNLLFSNNRGHGNSELGDSTEATFLTDCAKDRKELIEHLGLEQIHLVSHSMGALITTEMYEIDRRFDISKIVFVTPAVCNPLRTFPWSNIAKPLLELTDDALVRERTIAGMKLLLNSLTNPITSRIYYAYFKMATRSAVSFDSFRKFMESVLNVDPEVFVMAFGSMIDNGDKIGEKMREITCPVLAISGQNDFLIAPRALRILREYIPGAQLEIMPQSTHFPQAEQPERFNSLVYEFLRNGIHTR